MDLKFSKHGSCSFHTLLGPFLTSWKNISSIASVWGHCGANVQHVPNARSESFKSICYISYVFLILQVVQESTWVAQREDGTFRLSGNCDCNRAWRKGGVWKWVIDSPIVLNPNKYSDQGHNEPIREQPGKRRKRGFNISNWIITAYAAVNEMRQQREKELSISFEMSKPHPFFKDNKRG